MNPDWTGGIKLGRDRSGGFWVLDIVRQRANPGDVERLLLDTAMQDGKRVRIGFGQDSGQVGKNQAFYLARALSGFTVEPASENGDKLTRRTVQRAVPRRQRQDPVRLLERRAVPRPRRLPHLVRGFYFG